MGKLCNRVAVQLKTDSEVFQRVINGVKPWELRKNDRDYHVGDVLELRETKYTGIQMLYNGKPLEYTGRTIRGEVQYIIFGPVYGLVDGWVIMTVKWEHLKEGFLPESMQNQD